jgi:SAM-dependent methyltransferase
MIGDANRRMRQRVRQMKRCAPAAERNAEPILAVLRGVLPERGTVLEIASGTGQHAVHMARALPEITWQPTDADPDALASISAWVADARLPNLRPPLVLDVTGEWPMARADAVVCINMIHISPWSATEALFAGAIRVLPAAGPLVTYGPYRFHGRFRAPSNQAFDADLRGRDPAWGVRDVDDLEREAASHGFTLAETLAMPANNHTLVFAPQSRGKPLAWRVGRARRSLGPNLVPILEHELARGNTVQWTGLGWGEQGPFHASMRERLDFDRIERRGYARSVRRNIDAGPHSAQCDGYWCDESSTGIDGPLAEEG